MLESDDLFALQSMFANANVTVGDIASEYAADVAQLGKIARLNAVSAFASMLILPNLQANAYRLEALVHIAVAKSAGRQQLSAESVRKIFKRFGNGTCGRMEDPAEDLFTSSVGCRKGNFILFEGSREGNGFYLQRILDVLEGMPDRKPFAGLRRSVFALLALSDAAARRAGLAPGVMGESRPLSDVPNDVLNHLGKMRKWVQFSADDLELLNVDVEDLSPFIFKQEFSQLSDETLASSSLERAPVLCFDNLICLALPTSVGSAITLYLLAIVAASGNTNVFEKALALNYWELLSWTPFVSMGEPPPFAPSKESDWLVGSTLKEIDSGRYLHLVVINQPVEGIETEGFSAPCLASMELSHRAMEEVEKASKVVCMQPGFREGITLVVNCGLGQSSFFAQEELPSHWNIEFLSVHDAFTMAWMKDFEPIDLFRMADSKSTVASAGIHLINCNGLLNLWAWANDLHGHLVPHGEMPEGFRSVSTKRLIVVKQNGLLDLRAEIYARNHTLAAMNSKGEWRRVRRLAESVFEDDLCAPLYADEQRLKTGAFTAVYVSDSRFWWVDLSSNSGQRHELFEHWRMLCVWLTRVVPVVEPHFEGGLPSSLMINVHFEDIIDVAQPIQIPSLTDLANTFRTTVSQPNSTVNITVGKAFDSALASPDNTAEMGLVTALVQGIGSLARIHLESSAEAALVANICPSRHARSRHIMPAQKFRDMIRLGNSDPVRIHPMDEAITHIGIAFRVQPDIGEEITGIRECTSFLNETASLIMRELCVLLRSFNRHQFLEEVLERHEDAAISRNHWRRTAHANIALHGDSAAGIVAEHIGDMTVCSIASRILIEAAICECPIDGGFRPGELDISRSMAQAMFAFHIGGWSNAVHWGAIAPTVKITPLGDIHIDHAFMNKVFSPFHHAGAEREVSSAVDAYAKAYNELETVESVASLIEPMFIEAWMDEFGCSLDTLRKFADSLENIGVTRDALWFHLQRSELMSILADCAGRSPQDVASTIDLLTLPSRANWLSTPPGFRDKDWHPWRFRRRLSLVRRPFIQVDGDIDPRICVAPAIVRDALYILLRSFHNGETPDWQVSSRAMRKWQGHTNNVTRTAFNSSVAEKMREMGWNSESDYRITKLLGFPLDRDYGDVDALVWDPESGRVLAIECKDLHFHKTLGEVAEQLSDFRGHTKPDGTRDLLRKHLDRVVVMEQHRSVIKKRLRLKADAQIEGYVVFKNPVPMEYAWDETQPATRLLLESQLETLRLVSKDRLNLESSLG